MLTKMNDESSLELSETSLEKLKKLRDVDGKLIPFCDVPECTKCHKNSEATKVKKKKKYSN